MERVCSETIRPCSFGIVAGSYLDMISITAPEPRLSPGHEMTMSQRVLNTDTGLSNPIKFGTILFLGIPQHSEASFTATQGDGA